MNMRTMKAKKVIKEHKKRIKKLQNRIKETNEQIERHRVCMLEAIPDYLREEGIFNEAPWEMVSNANTRCNFHLIGGTHPMQPKPKAEMHRYTPRPKLFKALSDYIEKIEGDLYYTDLYYMHEKEGWTVTSSNGKTTVFFDSPDDAYNFIKKYGLAVNVNNIHKRIEELNVLVAAANAAEELDVDFGEEEDYRKGPKTEQWQNVDIWKP